MWRDRALGDSEAPSSDPQDFKEPHALLSEFRENEEFDGTAAVGLKRTTPGSR